MYTIILINGWFVLPDSHCDSIPIMNRWANYPPPPCIRRMTEGNIFSLSTLEGGEGGGYPHPTWQEEYPIWLTGGRYPHLDDRVVPPYGWWGVPCGTLPYRTGWGTPSWDYMELHPLGLDGGTPAPPPPHRRQSSRASTCYAAGGLPPAFTQENFLVWHRFSQLSLSDFWSDAVPFQGNELEQKSE